jgi:hypothetical protein
LRYEYVPDVEVIPDSFVLNAERDPIDSSVVSLPISIRSHWDHELEIASLSATDPQIICTIEKVQANQGVDKWTHFVCRCRLPKTWPPGQVDQAVEIHTNHPFFSVFKIPVRGEVDGPLKVSPRTIALGFVKPDQPIKRVVKLESSGQISLKSVTPEDRSVVLIGAVSQSQLDEAEIPLEIRPAKSGIFRTSINVVITTPIATEVKIVISGVVDSE